MLALGGIAFGLLATLAIRFVRLSCSGPTFKQQMQALDRVTLERWSTVQLLQWGIYDAERTITRIEKRARG